MKKQILIVLIALLAIAIPASAVSQWTQTVGAYTVVTFNGTAGSTTWSVPPGVTTADVFLVGGGGSGRGELGGGGGGGYTRSYVGTTHTGAHNLWDPVNHNDGTAISVSGTYDIIVGAGGVGGVVYEGSGGGYSRFGSDATYQAYGGDRGTSSGGMGGCGGGATGIFAVPENGGYGGTDGSDGGGGLWTGANPGTGQGHTTKAFGENTGDAYAGGGGGAGDSRNAGSNVGGTGGLNGGGNGGGNNNGYVATDGKDGYGAGGGGGGYNGAAQLGADGGSGIVIIRYLTPIVVSPVASFTGNPLSGISPLTVQFTDTSTNTPTSWSWDFGDSQTSTIQNPSHTFTSAGVYSVSLTATNAGGSDTMVKANYISITPPLPGAGFTANTTSGTSPLTVQFTDTSTNTPTSWSWDFGDSQTSTIQNPSHTFTSAGVYSVSLTATNAGGSNTMVKSNYITVQSPLPTSGVVSISNGYINQPGENTTLTLRLDNAVQGLGGYNVNVSVSNPTVAEITSIAFPSWASSMNTSSPLPATQNVLIKASDVNHLVETGATNIELATITVIGLSPGETSLVLSSTNVDDDDGLDISHTLTNGDLTVDYPLTDPEISDITPSSGYTNGSVMVVLNGTGFRSGAAVKLTLANQSDIIGTNVAFVSRHRVDCTFDLTGKQPGAWNVTLTNTDDKTATLTNGFTLVRPLVPVTGMISLPADLDLDGLTEDINHNGQKDYADVNTFFTAFEWIVENEPVAAFDFNGTGTLGFGDIVALFDMIS